MVSEREERANLRRQAWLGEVVANGTPKVGMYSALTGEERLEALARLNKQVWLAMGVASAPAIPRKDWPGEIFEISKRENR